MAYRIRELFSEEARLERQLDECIQDFQNATAAHERGEYADREHWGEVHHSVSRRREASASLLDAYRGKRLSKEAAKYDIEMPTEKGRPEFYWQTLRCGFVLNPQGRTYLRRALDEEKTRRREVKTYWVTRIILPVTTVLIGLIGAITGLIAVIYR